MFLHLQPSLVTVGIILRHAISISHMLTGPRIKIKEMMIEIAPVVIAIYVKTSCLCLISLLDQVSVPSRIAVDISDGKKCLAIVSISILIAIDDATETLSN